MVNGIEVFRERFGNLIAEGGYELQEKSSGTPQFYIFSKPGDKTFIIKADFKIHQE